MLKALKQYIIFLRNPLSGWKQLQTDTTTNRSVIIYWIMLCASICSVIGTVIERVEWLWDIAIIDLLSTFVSLLAGFHLACFLIRWYYEQTEKKSLPYSRCIHFVAFSASCLYSVAALVNLTHMALFWVLSLYLLKIVLEATQSQYVEVEEKHKYTFVWVVSLIIIAASWLTNMLFGLILTV